MDKEKHPEEKELTLKSFKPYRRNNEAVERMRAGSPKMILHHGITLPLVRPAPHLTQEERNEPIMISKNTFDKKTGKRIERWLMIAYVSVKGKKIGAPSHRWYDIQMALFEELQNNGYNSRTVKIDSINRVVKRIKSNHVTVMDDLRKATGIWVDAHKWFLNPQTGNYHSSSGLVFANFKKAETPSGLVRGAEFTFAEDYFNYIQNSLVYTNRTYDRFFELDSTVAKMLMQRLMLGRFHAKLPPSQDLYVWERDIKQLGMEIALSTDNIGNLTKNFNNAGSQLKDIGFIVDGEVVRESKTESGRKVKLMYKWKPNLWRVKPPKYAEGTIVCASVD